MKIRSVTLQNLNSIEGRWNIDFSDAAFDQGIFLISGPTGSGKTTLMDAICLALYGQTPRLKPTGSRNEIMTRGCGECGAEVVFETRKGLFRGEWLQQKKKAGKGEKLEKARSGIYAHGSGESGQKTIAETINLDFMQFRRAVMLAQGEFTAFLKAADKERADILEKITDTGIYTQISAKVYDLHERAAKKVEQLNDVREKLNVLKPEDEEGLREDLRDSLAMVAELDGICASHDEVIAWHKKMEEYRKDINLINNELKQLAREEDAFQDRYASLKLAISAEPLEQIYNDLKKEQNRAASLATYKQSLDASKKECGDKKAINDRQLGDISRNLSIYENTIRVNRDFFQNLLDLDIIVRQKEEERKYMLANYEGAKVIFGQQTAKLRDMDVQKAELERELAKIKYIIDSSGKYENALAKLGGFKIALEEIEKKSGELKSATVEQLQSKARVAALQGKSAGHRDKMAQKQLERKDTENCIVEAEKRYDKFLAGKAFEQYQREKEALLIKKYKIDSALSFGDHRAKLLEGEPCPLCGATHHPYAKGTPGNSGFVDDQLDAINKLLDNAKILEMEIKELRDKKNILDKSLADLEKEGNDLENQTKITQSGLENGSRRVQDLEGDIAARKSALLANLAEYMKIDNSGQIGPALKKLESRALAWQDSFARQEALKKELEKLEVGIQAQTGHTRLQEEELRKKEADLAGVNLELQRMLGRRQREFGNLDPQREKDLLENMLEKAKISENSLKESALQIEKQLADIEARLDDLGKNESASLQKREEMDRQFREALNNSPFGNLDDFLRAIMDEAQKQKLRAQAADLDKRKNRLLGAKQSREESLAQEERRNLDAKKLSCLLNAREEADKCRADLQREGGIFQNRIDQNARVKGEVEELEKELGKWRLEQARLAKLNNLIGTKSGIKFSRMAQDITFGIIISFANEYLSKLRDRYLLVPSRDKALNVDVLDKYQGGEIRSLATLSGGETFLVSLALALGLSRMASENSPIDSLFLDEGFGTLDEETLNTALDALTSLSNQGKMIGIISHVPELANRIGTHINVIPVGNGKSIISGPGCVKY